jgi:hypothetical protein
VNITINKRLTRRSLGDIIRPMKSEKNSARVGTLFARQNPCQTGREILVIFTPKSFDRPPHSRGTIALLIRWANQLNKETSYV